MVYFLEETNKFGFGGTCRDLGTQNLGLDEHVGMISAKTVIVILTIEIHVL
jgi:hypothetical protein